MLKKISRVFTASSPQAAAAAGAGPSPPSPNRPYPHLARSPRRSPRRPDSAENSALECEFSFSGERDAHYGVGGGGGCSRHRGEGGEVVEGEREEGTATRQQHMREAELEALEKTRSGVAELAEWIVQEAAQQSQARPGGGAPFASSAVLGLEAVYRIADVRKSAFLRRLLRHPVALDPLPRLSETDRARAFFSAALWNFCSLEADAGEGGLMHLVFELYTTTQKQAKSARRGVQPGRHIADDDADAPALSLRRLVRLLVDCVDLGLDRPDTEVEEQVVGVLRDIGTFISIVSPGSFSRSPKHGGVCVVRSPRAGDDDTQRTSDSSFVFTSEEDECTDARHAAAVLESTGQVGAVSSGDEDEDPDASDRPRPSQQHKRGSSGRMSPRPRPSAASVIAPEPYVDARKELVARIMRTAVSQGALASDVTLPKVVFLRYARRRAVTAFNDLIALQEHFKEELMGADHWENASLLRGVLMGQETDVLDYSRTLMTQLNTVLSEAAAARQTLPPPIRITSSMSPGVHGPGTATSSESGKTPTRGSGRSVSSGGPGAGGEQDSVTVTPTAAALAARAAARMGGGKLGGGTPTDDGDSPRASASTKTGTRRTFSSSRDSGTQKGDSRRAHTRGSNGAGSAHNLRALASALDERPSSSSKQRASGSTAAGKRRSPRPRNSHSQHQQRDSSASHHTERPSYGAEDTVSANRQTKRTPRQDIAVSRGGSAATVEDALSVTAPIQRTPRGSTDAITAANADRRGSNQSVGSARKRVRSSTDSTNTAGPTPALPGHEADPGQEHDHYDRDDERITGEGYDDRGDHPQLLQSARSSADARASSPRSSNQLVTSTRSSEGGESGSKHKRRTSMGRAIKSVFGKRGSGSARDSEVESSVDGEDGGALRGSGEGGSGKRATHIRARSLRGLSGRGSDPSSPISGRSGFRFGSIVKSSREQNSPAHSVRGTPAVSPVPPAGGRAPQERHLAPRAASARDVDSPYRSGVGTGDALGEEPIHPDILRLAHQRSSESQDGGAQPTNSNGSTRPPELGRFADAASPSKYGAAAAGSGKPVQEVVIKSTSHHSASDNERSSHSGDRSQTQDPGYTHGHGRPSHSHSYDRGEGSRSSTHGDDCYTGAAPQGGAAARGSGSNSRGETEWMKSRGRGGRSPVPTHQGTDRRRNSDAMPGPTPAEPPSARSRRGSDPGGYRTSHSHSHSQFSDERSWTSNYEDSATEQSMHEVASHADLGIDFSDLDPDALAMASVSGGRASGCAPGPHREFGSPPPTASPSSGRERRHSSEGTSEPNSAKARARRVWLKRGSNDSTHSSRSDPATDSPGRHNSIDVHSAHHDDRVSSPQLSPSLSLSVSGRDSRGSNASRGSGGSSGGGGGGGYAHASRGGSGRSGAAATVEASAKHRLARRPRSSAPSLQMASPASADGVLNRSSGTVPAEGWTRPTTHTPFTPDPHGSDGSAFPFPSTSDGGGDSGRNGSGRMPLGSAVDDQAGTGSSKNSLRRTVSDRVGHHYYHQQQQRRQRPEQQQEGENAAGANISDPQLVAAYEAQAQAERARKRKEAKAAEREAARNKALQYVRDGLLDDDGDELSEEEEQERSWARRGRPRAVGRSNSLPSDDPFALVEGGGRSRHRRTRTQPALEPGVVEAALKSPSSSEDETDDNDVGGGGRSQHRRHRSGPTSHSATKSGKRVSSSDAYAAIEAEAKSQARAQSGSPHAQPASPTSPSSPAKHPIAPSSSSTSTGARIRFGGSSISTASNSSSDGNAGAALTSHRLRTPTKKPLSPTAEENSFSEQTDGSGATPHAARALEHVSVPPVAQAVAARRGSVTSPHSSSVSLEVERVELDWEAVCRLSEADGPDVTNEQEEEDEDDDGEVDGS